jgi:hypothetical protein
MAANTEPVLLSELDIDPTVFPCSPDTILVPLINGLSSRVYRVGSTVLKVSRAHGSEARMLKQGRIMQGEEQMMRGFIGDNMPETSLHLVPRARKANQHRVLTVQDFIAGPTLPDYMAQTAAPTDKLAKFLNACMGMYFETGKIPDVANIQDGFDPFQNTNIIMANDGSDGIQPVLVDTNFGRIQRANGLGGLLSAGIAYGVTRAIEKLSWTNAFQQQQSSR